MTFELVHLGWPNTVTILALAIMPVVALTATADRRPVAVQFERIEAATTCQPGSECSLTAFALAEADVLE
jgi:hypothetical protein